MARNIEIKARARDFARQSRLAAEIATAGPELLEQHDTFFRVPHGRLKLRLLGEGRGELIAYERADSQGPKTSEYQIFPTEQPALLEQVLTKSLGVCGVVAKKRTVYFHGPTRIHLDEVAGLGQFLELEVVLTEDQPEAEGHTLAEDLIEGAYIDLMT